MQHTECARIKVGARRLPWTKHGHASTMVSDHFRAQEGSRLLCLRKLLVDGGYATTYSHLVAFRYGISTKVGQHDYTISTTHATHAHSRALTRLCQT
jgi:hypothetical protein